MRRTLLLVILWLLAGCASVPDDGSQPSLGTVTVQDGLISTVTSEAIPLRPGQPVPDGFLDEPVSDGRFHYRLEEGECTGTGRLLRCPGALQVVDAFAFPPGSRTGGVGSVRPFPLSGLAQI